jgi:hypothetical protein
MRQNYYAMHVFLNLFSFSEDFSICGSHVISYEVVTADSIVGDTVTKKGRSVSLTSVYAEFQNSWSCALTSPYAYMACKSTGLILRF